jgi:hypothetical protein
MKKINLILMLLIAAATLQLQAQERYLDMIFDDFEVETRSYGANVTVLTVPVTGEVTLRPLAVDIYTPPAEDMETNRPLVLYFHTGNFLPYPANNGTGGTMKDSTVVEVASRLARMGYVCGVVDYRKGWNPLAATQEERTNTLINAAYRGVQDSRTAVRYFKRTVAEEGNPWGVDTTRIVAWGQGTGGYISFASATIDQYPDIVLPKFIGQDITGDGQPDPMVLLPIHGDPDGTTFGINPASGDTLCVPNHVGYGSEFDLAVNMGGALGDTSWLDASDPPFISFHSPTDAFAPYTEGILIVPTTNEQVVEVQGSYLVAQKANQLGLNDIFVTANFQDEITMIANSRNDGLNGLYPLTGLIPTDSGPWDWWDPATNVNHETGIMLNPNMSPERARTYIDTIMAYYAPRACAALFLPCSPVGTQEALLDAKEVGLIVAPNPAIEEVRLQTNAAYPVKDLLLYDISGRLVQTQFNLSENNIVIPREDLPSGMYFARLRFEDKGSLVQKIIFK